jgi:hypothetical protein
MLHHVAPCCYTAHGAAASARPATCCWCSRTRLRYSTVQGAAVAGHRVAAGDQAVFEVLADLLAQRGQDVAGRGVGQVRGGDFEHQLADRVGGGGEVVVDDGAQRGKLGVGRGIGGRRGRYGRRGRLGGLRRARWAHRALAGRCGRAWRVGG